MLERQPRGVEKRPLEMRHRAQVAGTRRWTPP
jgi:hypothetical protein